MHENFVDYGKELLIANETQRNKIEFLERERLKRDHFLSDLQENLNLNKETLRQFNQFGSNSAAVDSLNREAQILIARLKQYYEEYQSINASLLMEQQMRLSDRQLYEERLVEFENKMVDLRKYLHDKEESFSSVVTRLKRYEDLSEPTLEDKLQNYKKEIGERHVHEFIADLIREKNSYQRECETMRKHYFAFNQIKNILVSRYQEVEEMLENFEKDYAVKISNLANLKNTKSKEDDHPKWKAVNPNSDLIRLLKKEKINIQLLQGALSDAIQKNEQLVAINDFLEKNIHQLENKCRLLRAENLIFALRLAEYDQHYCRASTHSRKYYQEGQIQGLRYITEERLREYAISLDKYYQSNNDLQKQFNEKMKREVEKWSKLICDSQAIKEDVKKEGHLMKSSSVPKLLVNFELDEMEEPMIIEQF